MSARGEDNKVVVDAFQEMSDLLEIKGDDPHRAKAFRNAARILGGVRIPLSTAMEDGTLKRLRGLGEGTVGRVKELIRTGSCDTLTRLRREIPSTLRPFLEIPSLGPRTARLVWQTLGVTSLDALLVAAKDGRLARVPGISAEHAAEILESIDDTHKSNGPLLWTEAHEIAERVIFALKKTGLVTDIACCGSYRRGRALVGDLDLVAAAPDPKALLAGFVALDDVVRVLMHGNDRARVRLKNGHKVDLWIVPPESFGAGLIGFSSGTEHNIALRLRATKMGFKLSEYGIFDDKSGAPAGSALTENDVFKLLALPFIAPELREGVGEIALAEKGRLPELVTEGTLKCDLGVTLDDDEDGDDDAPSLAVVARSHGLRFVVVLIDPAGGSRGETLHTVGPDSHPALTILRALVLPVDDVDGMRATLSAHRADFLYVTAPTSRTVSAAALTALYENALDALPVAALYAPTGRRLRDVEPLQFDVDRILKVMARRGTALIANASPFCVDPDEHIIRLATSRGIPVGFASGDVKTHMGQGLRAGVALLRRGFVPRENVLNVGDVARVPHRLTATESPTSVDGDSGDDVVDLSVALRSSPLPPHVRTRLERFLVEGNDNELESHLRALGEPLQVAFRLILENAESSS